MEGVKIVSAQEMARIEKQSIEEGASAESYMDQAAQGIADYITTWIEGRPREFTLLAGKGNNGGDAFAVGEILLERGFAVDAVHLFSPQSCSPLCQMKRAAFLKRGGVLRSEGEFVRPILDGIVGTGFLGEMQGAALKTILSANQSGQPIFSIDIPSGLDGTTGRVRGGAIKALTTFYLGLPKMGFFLEKGWEHVGKLVGVDFGLSSSALNLARPLAYLPERAQLFNLMPPIQRTRHKYERGYVVGFAGSPAMPGAAALSCHAALRAGSGIVRLFCPPHTEIENFPELICSDWTSSDTTELFEEIKRAKALLIGPGLGKNEEALEVIKKLLRSPVPSVVDAEAIRVFQEKIPHPPQTVLTPHRGEFSALIEYASTSLEEWAQRFVDERGVTLVLKGAPTWVFHPQSLPFIVPYGDPGMATAGSGDVLTGIIAALLSQGLFALPAALLGACLHGFAGEAAASKLSSYSVMASDLIDEIPQVIKSLI